LSFLWFESNELSKDFY